MRKLVSFLTAFSIILCCWGCSKPQLPQVTTEPSTEPVTEAAEPGMERYDLSRIDLAGIGEMLIARGQEALCKLQLDGLCTPVVLELEGTQLRSITAYGITAQVDPAAEEFAAIYGNLSPAIYDHNGLVFLNIWHGDIGYSCVMCPDGTYMETFPDEEYSVMIYVNSDDRMVQSQFARKFAGIDQWETGPIEMATGRDDFYYSIDAATWTQGKYSVTAMESYTISDCFELDEIFYNAKADGLYPAFDTLDELLASNAGGRGPDSTRETVSYFDEVRAVYDYDGRHNLITETFYTMFDQEFFVKEHSYDDRDLEVAGSWFFQGQEAYRYTHTYDSKDRLTETVWYTGQQEVERLQYTYGSSGGYTETFSQKGEKKYTYTFNEDGELTAHSVYQDGKEVATKDVKKLVKAQLLTDIWFPFIDNGTLHFGQRYNGTVPVEAPREAEAVTASDGSYKLVYENADEEDGQLLHHEYHYNAKDRLIKAIHRTEDGEYLRDEYQYNSKGLRTEQTTYLDGEKDMVSKFEYNAAGQLVRLERTHIFKNESPDAESSGEEAPEYLYAVREETYRYNKKGQLVETVTYAEGQQTDQRTFAYDENGYVLPATDTYEYVYNHEGVLQEIWLIYEDWSSGAAQLRSRTVYVTAENAHQLQRILHDQLSWL